MNRQALSWNDVGLRHGTDKATIGPRDGLGHGYLPHYERVLADRKIQSILEIGVQSGASLLTWVDLFPDARVVGIDQDPDCALIPGPFEVYVGNAGDPDQFPTELLDSTFDLIIDDGSHALWETRPNTAVWSQRLAPGGVYVVEDAVLGSTTWVQPVPDVIAMLLSFGLTPFEIVRGQMPWVAHERYGGMMCVVFADASCPIPG